MAAAQIAKKLKDRRQRQTLVEIFKKIDKEGNGYISLSDYFNIFTEHEIDLSENEYKRVLGMAGPDGIIRKDDFIKIIRSSPYFFGIFDKNKDGVVTEIRKSNRSTRRLGVTDRQSELYSSLATKKYLQTEMTTRAELAFKALDKDNSGYISEKELTKLSSRLTDEDMGVILKKFDVDGDGKLSFEEFRMMLDRNASKKKKNNKK